MILLILFYFAMVIVAGLLIAFGFSFYLKNRRLSAPQDQRINLYPPDPRIYRPLFAPSESDLLASERAEEKAKQERAQEEKRLAAEKESAAKMADTGELFTQWAKAPDTKRLGELLAAAAGTESAEFFSEISKNVIQIWHNKKIAGLTAADLAALLDSHLRLLPQQEMASGALFWLKEDIAALRNETEKNNLQG
ncbi:MAG TPA: hypothetical protein VGO50_05680 [Pyrinomonadaceae bacterium]|jgi:hypothetical protein|nr:hypothetical protein [Pyrinomonadaceae bacterium]